MDHKRPWEEIRSRLDPKCEDAWADFAAFKAWFGSRKPITTSGMNGDEVLSVVQDADSANDILLYVAFCDACEHAAKHRRTNDETV